MPAFRLAVQQGADAFELDVRLSTDGVPVVLHDPTLDRTTDRKGPLAARSLAELEGVDAGARFTLDGGRSYPFRGGAARVPTLAEVLRGFPEIPVMVEVKEPAAQEAVRRTLLEEGAVGRCVLASEHHAALQVFRRSPFVTAASGPEIGALYRAALLRRPPAGGTIPHAVGARAPPRAASSHPASWPRPGRSAARFTSGPSTIRQWPSGSGAWACAES